ncbi:hypothetical protein [Dolichospermum sp. LEGE 00246]|uniref:hypothetical protein n=1 Tax=Dolichospermum sp. LEGE 00246 TaxID=1828605 RepID=UPI001D14D2A2|nr:hypothetical protein [Dolichospermum sp. LEGE 00246]
MPIALYMDVHVPQAITSQLCRRGVDVLTAFDDETQELPDDKLLERLKRVLFTQDIRFRVLAETLQIEGKQFSGLIFGLFGHQLGGTIGQFVKDLEFIAQASEIDECS